MSARTESPLFPAEWGGVTTAATLGLLGVLTWGVFHQAQRLHSPAQHVAALVLLAVATVSVVLWVVLRDSSGPVADAAVVCLILSGSALVAFVGLAAVYPAIGAIGASTRWRIQVALVVVGAGSIAMAVAVRAVDQPWGVFVGGLEAIAAGLVVGYGRRQTTERAEQASRIEVARARAEVEHSRAELLSERNHMARELHDVLAHTLAALSLQLEAFETVVDQEPGTNGPIRAQLELTRRLVRDGLDEARGAVQALRDDAAPLQDQLAKLATQHRAELEISGQPIPLSPQIVVTLYRVAQESLTNVMKHAPGAAEAITLQYDTDRVALTVENATSTTVSPLADSGGGYGLRGLEERLALVGGRLEAGPSPKGWRVRAEVPVPVVQVQPAESTLRA